MKSEKDFKEGSVVIFASKEGMSKRAGEVDYSEGSEQEGYIRVRQVFCETSDVGNVLLIPVGRIFSNPGGD